MKLLSISSTSSSCFVYLMWNIKSSTTLRYIMRIKWTGLDLLAYIPLLAVFNIAGNCSRIGNCESLIFVRKMPPFGEFLQSPMLPTPQSRGKHPAFNRRSLLRKILQFKLLKSVYIILSPWCGCEEYRTSHQIRRHKYMLSILSVVTFGVRTFNHRISLQK
jgi:hypothetical protein